MTEPRPGADELRVRHALRARGVGPDAAPLPSMPAAPPAGYEPRDCLDDDKPIVPTRIIPSAAPLPDRAPHPGEVPPWRTPPPPPHDPDTRPVELRHTHEVVLTWADPDPEPRPRLWARLWDRLVTWRMLAAILAALTPWAGGQSPVGLWSHTLHQARTEAGIGAAYIIAAVAVAAAWALDRRTGRVVPRFLFVTAALGAFGVLHWWDPILMLTGVSR